MDTIVVYLRELKERVAELESAGIDYVAVSILEPDGEGEYALPPRLEFEGIRADEPDVGILFESVDAVPDEEFVLSAFHHETTIQD